MSTYTIPPQRVPLVDQRGNVTREWYLFLSNVRNKTAESVVMIEDTGVSPMYSGGVVEQMQALESRVHGLECLPIGGAPTAGSTASGGNSYFPGGW